MTFYTYLPMKLEQTECSEMSAYKIQTLGNYREENIQQICTALCFLETFYSAVSCTVIWWPWMWKMQCHS